MQLPWLIVVFSLWPIGQAGPTHEAIHPADRVFTADEFRQQLLLLKGEKAILDMFQDSKLSSDQQKKLLEFAQRLAAKNQPSEDKKDLPIPPGLLKNPQLQKILENEKLLEWLADNERIQAMAERMAERWNLPQLSPKDRSPGLSPSKEGAAPREDSSPGTGPPQTPPREKPSARSDNPAPPAVGDASEPREPTATPDGADATAPPSASPSESQSPLEGLTDRLRRLAPLSQSPTLNRIDDMLDGSVPVPTDPPTPDEPTQSPALPSSLLPADSGGWEQLWQELPWVSNSPVPLGEIPLPPGLENWAPSLESLPLPSIVLPGVALPTVGGASLPTLPSSFDPTVSPAGLLNPLGVILLVVGSLLVLRYVLLADWFDPSSPRANRRFFSRPPSQPFDPSSRPSVVAWFEYAAFRRLGPRARSMSHVDWKNAIDRDAAGWPDLYAQARYAPADQPLDADLSARAPADLDRLTQTS
jgi:hypothetical protein